MKLGAHGLPIDFEVTGGEVRDTIRKKSSIPVIPRKSNTKIGNADMDWSLYK